jgi:predicted nucleic acid-binding protein
MSVGRTTSLFFDASCLIAAAGSPGGGSGFLLSLCARRLLRAVVSQATLYEAERNIQAKRGQIVLRAYHSLLIAVPFHVAPVPIVPPVAHWLKYVNAKDAHVVISVLASEAPYLLTLDQNLIFEIGQANLPFVALTPGMFINDLLVQHADYGAMRD